SSLRVPSPSWRSRMRVGGEYEAFFYFVLLFTLGLIALDDEHRARRTLALRARSPPARHGRRQKRPARVKRLVAAGLAFMLRSGHRLYLSCPGFERFRRTSIARGSPPPAAPSARAPCDGRDCSRTPRAA